MDRKNIRDFKNIRSIVANIYTYGFNTREKFIQSGDVGSPRAYDDIIRQLRDLYYSDYDGEESAFNEDDCISGRHKQYRFKRNYFSPIGNTLAAAYGLYAVSDDAIANTLRCLSLASKKEGTTVTQATRLSEYASGENRTPTISRRLKNLRASGYVVSGKKTNYLNLVFSDISDEELIGLYYLTSFYAGAGYPRIPSVFLRKAIWRQIIYRKLPDPPEAFLFRDNACGNVFDEQIVYQLLCCCKNHTAVEIVIRGKTQTLKPVFLKNDTKTGRWYLLAMRGEMPQLMRVSNIKEVKPLQEKFDYEHESSIIKQAYQYSYISGEKTSSSIVHVEAELMFTSPAMRAQFERELLLGRIEQDGNVEVYCADVNDISEIRPFLRSYGAYIKVRPSNEHNLDIELRGEYERMLSKYGIV